MEKYVYKILNSARTIVVAPMLVCVQLMFISTMTFDVYMHKYINIYIYIHSYIQWLLLLAYPDIDVPVGFITAIDVCVTVIADTVFTFQHIARVAGSYSEFLQG